MRFLHDNSEITFEQFSRHFPGESEILADAQDLSVDFEIDLESMRIKLISEHANPIFLNVHSELEYHKRFWYHQSVHKQPLAKALGIKKGIEGINIVDATAGMLGDTLLIQSFCIEQQNKHRVIAVERHPVAAALSLNALKSENLDIPFYYGDIAKVDLSSEGQMDVVYFDPMYKEINSKTKPKKEMLIFRDVIGSDLDAIDVATYLVENYPRVVLKRSIKAQPAIAKPNIQYNGKSTAYDVYLNN